MHLRMHIQHVFHLFNADHLKQAWRVIHALGTSVYTLIPIASSLEVFSEKRPRVELSKAIPSQTIGQSQRKHDKVARLDALRNGVVLKGERTVVHLSDNGRGRQVVALSLTFA